MFRLLFLLSSLDEGIERSEVFAALPAYEGSNRMFERDLSCLERLGFTIERQRRGSNPALYRAIAPENLFKQIRERKEQSDAKQY